MKFAAFMISYLLFLYCNAFDFYGNSVCVCVCVLILGKKFESVGLALKLLAEWNYLISSSILIRILEN